MFFKQFQQGPLTPFMLVKGEIWFQASKYTTNISQKYFCCRATSKLLTKFIHYFVKKHTLKNALHIDSVNQEVVRKYRMEEQSNMKHVKFLICLPLGEFSHRPITS